MLRVLLSLAIPVVMLYADAAGGDPRREKLFGQFLGPCCWRENLRVHQSPTAKELRADIERRIREGETDAQIQEAVVAKYTQRILVEPEGTPGEWLRAIPWVATAAGLGLVGWFIRRAMAPRAAPVTMPGAQTKPLPELPDSEWI